MSAPPYLCSAHGSSSGSLQEGREGGGGEQAWGAGKGGGGRRTLADQALPHDAKHDGGARITLGGCVKRAHDQLMHTLPR